MKMRWIATALLLCVSATLNAQDQSASPIPSSVQTGVAPGRLTHKVDPKYPEKARQKKIEGSVVMQAVIAKDGKVRDLHVVSGDPLLAAAAMKAVRHWRYESFMLQGKPVEVKTNITVNFKLDNSARVSCGQKTVYASAEVPLGTGVGSGSAGNMSIPTVLKVGNGVTAPRAIHAPDPEYTRRAQKAKYQGTVLLWAVVGPDGSVQDIKVARSLGMGLDEKAVEAVCKWRFKPAMKEGQPVAVQINVEVSFRLY